MENKIRLQLVGITYNQIESGVYALVLQQVGGARRIPIIIGFPEAQAIECKLQEIIPPRPLTHDTMVAALSSFGVNLKEVMIKKLPNGVFAADLYLTDGINDIIIDSRSSDAIALAIRVNAPIYTTESVLMESGFDPKEKKSASVRKPANTPERKQPSGQEFAIMSDLELEKAMEKAVETENYEEAAKIKNEIDRRKLNNP